MALSIPLTGWAANDPTPGNLVEVSFAQGPASGASGQLAILVIANKLATGSATVGTTLYGPDTATPAVSLIDWANLTGLGSEAYRIFKRILAVNSTTPLYGVFPAESAGAKATGTITIATTATANGVHRTSVCDEFVDTQINNNDTPTVIATQAVLDINAKTDWPCVATNSSGVITLTANQKGLRGNLLRYGAQIFGNSIATTTAPAPTAVSFFTGGTTTDTWTTALATVNPRRFYYIISGDDGSQSSTGLTALLAQVATQQLPTNGIRQKVSIGAIDATSSNINTIAIAANTARADLFYQIAGDVPPGELAAMVTAGEAAYEATLDGAHVNFDNFGQTATSAPYWRLKPATSGVSFTPTQIKSALNNGVSPIQTTTNGKTYLVSRITTKSQTSSVADYRIRDSHKVRICDRFADDTQAKAALNLAGKTIANDPASVAIKPPPGAVTPSLYKATVLFTTLDTYVANGLVDRDRLAAIRAGTVANRETSPSTRLTAYMPLEPIDVLHATGLFLAQVA